MERHPTLSALIVALEMVRRKHGDIQLYNNPTIVGITIEPGTDDLPKRAMFESQHKKED